MPAVSRDPTPDEQLADALAEFYADPLGHVIFSYPWDTEPSIQLVELPARYQDRFNVWCQNRSCPLHAEKGQHMHGPDEWECDFLEELGQEIRLRGFDGTKAVPPIQFSTSSGHGIGKSVTVAHLVKFILDTRPFSIGTLTANTETQLRTKTWAEVGKWHRISMTAHWFDYKTGRGAMALEHKAYPQQWKCSAQTSREENSEAFAGQHAANSTSFYIFDEGSGIADKIYEVREGGTTDGEPMTFDFGNPTRNSGKFFENCVGKFRHRYKVRQIDSRSVAITNKERIQQWIDDYGLDSDFVKVRVLGQFPAAGTCQFIPTPDVEAAMARETFVDRSAQLVIGVDVARFGDDESVIWPRLGMDARSFAPVPGKGRLRGLDTVQVTGKVIECVREFRALGMNCAGLFVDGGGIGAGVVDQLRHLGYAPIEVQFGGKATDANTYRYKSDEMWGNMRDALKTRLILPSTGEVSTDIYSQLTQREFGYTLLGNKIHLETKKDMKERGISSPDLADALALTFAQEVAPALPPGMAAQTQSAKSDYDPLEATW